MYQGSQDGQQNRENGEHNHIATIGMQDTGKKNTGKKNTGKKNTGKKDTGKI